MKRAILICNMLAAVVFGGVIFITVPVTKLPTENAMAAIEDQFIRTGLDEEQNEKYQFYKRWILENSDNSIKSWSRTRTAGLVFCLLVFMSNGVLIILDKKEYARFAETRMEVSGLKNASLENS